MKHKILTFIMLLTIMTNLLVACGEKAPTNATIDGTQVEQTPESITPEAEPTTEPQDTIAPDDGNDESGVVESGTLDDVPDGNETNDILGDYESIGTRMVFTSLFPAGSVAEAWNEEHRFENPNYSFYITHFKGAEGTMDFTWVGPVDVGELWGLSTNERTFDVANDNYRLYMWYGGKLANESEFMRNFSKDEIMSVSNLPYDADSFQVIETDNTYKVIFQVSTQLDNKEYIGYECWIERYDEMATYMFEYLVEKSLFNEVETLAVVSSIEPINLDDLGIIVEE